MSRLNKRQKRVLRQEGVLDENARFRNFSLRSDIKPMTDTQQDAWDSWEDGSHLFLHGIAGTGKTFIAMYLALREVFENTDRYGNGDENTYQKVYIVRSTVPSREQGFMPGTQKQKEAVYEEPYIDIGNKLFGRKDAYELIKQRDKVEFRSTSFLRGCTFENCILIIDECQNMADNELHTVMTRVGENCKIIFCGDVKQDDLTSERKKEVSGLRNFMKVIRNMKEFDFIEFMAEDIVRSALVKSYIIERDKLGL